MAENSAAATKDDFEALIDLLAEDDETGLLVQPMAQMMMYPEQQSTPVQRVQVSLYFCLFEQRG